MNFEKLDKCRYKNKPWGTSDGMHHGLFFIPTKGNVILKVLSSGLQDPKWFHVSVSLPNRCPTWEEMCLVKELFYGDDALVVQYHPKKEDSVNNHSYCLHLWQNMEQEIPTPSSILVGDKKLGTLI